MLSDLEARVSFDSLFGRLSPNLNIGKGLGFRVVPFLVLFETKRTQLPRTLAGCFAQAAARVALADCKRLSLHLEHAM